MNAEIYISPSMKESLENAEIPTAVAEVLPPPIEPLIEDVVEQATTQPTTAPTQAAPVVERKPMTTKAKRSMCKVLVNAFDMGQEMFFTNAADKKLVKRISQNGKTENYLLELVRREAEGEKDFDEEERSLLKMFKKFQRFTEKVPFDNDTKDEIIDAMVDYMDEKGISFSPEMALLVNVVGSLTANFVALKML
jgi:hypothetical protein